jgi:hypothetical protein
MVLRARIVIPAAALAALALAVAVASGAAAASRLHVSAPAGPPLAPAAAAAAAETAGIPQHALILGSSSAKVSVVEYADLVCASCASVATSVVAPAIESFVGTGTARFQFEPIVEGPQSEEFALGAYAAGAQQQGWDYVMLAYLCTTSVSDGPLYGAPALAGALGINMPRWRAQIRNPRWPNQIEQSAKVALLGGFSSYPVFIVRGPGIRPSKLTQGRSVLILRPPVTLAALTKAILAAEPQSG